VGKELVKGGEGDCKQTKMKKKEKISNKITKIMEFTLEKKIQSSQTFGSKK